MMQDRKKVVDIRGLSFSYDGYLVLDRIDFDVKENDFIGITGPNGGGKTTLLKIIVGLLKPAAGSVKILGKTPEESRKNIGYVPQHSNFDEHFPINVLEVVLLGLMGKKGMARYFSRTDRKTALEALDKVGVRYLSERPIGELSYGQRQRVFIARAIVNSPSLLLLDEPTASVDVKAQKNLYDMLAAFKKKMAILLVTHDIMAMSVHAEKIGCLNRKLYYHDSEQISVEDLRMVYARPVDIIAHGEPHKIIKAKKSK